MASYSSSIQLISVYYDGDDSEAYAPDLAFITSTRSGAVTLCLDCIDEDKS